jgi:protein TonB
MLTSTNLPGETAAVTDHAAVGVRLRRGAWRTHAHTLNWLRVGALALVATGHIVGIGLLALPDTETTHVEPIQRRMADAPDSDRLTLFVDLEPAPTPPLRPMPPRLARSVPAPPPVVVETDAPTPASVPVATPLVAAAPPPPAASATVAATAAPAASAASSRPRGDPAQVKSDRDAYMRALMAALLQHRSYPAEARKQRARGVVQVRFSVDRDGHVLSSNIARGAGYAILEAAALEVLRSADPLPPIPDSLGVDRLTVTVPIEYSLITR